uniref:Uncharacterized protein n=1 Tax=Macaca nemestrina TaxID=9545 RepID=A0A2K6B3Q8_MACNE
MSDTQEKQISVVSLKYNFKGHYQQQGFFYTLKTLCYMSLPFSYFGVLLLLYNGINENVIQPLNCHYYI